MAYAPYHKRLDADIKLDFDDVLMVPQPTDITSRSEVNLVANISGVTKKTITGVPIIAANMDGVGTFSMNAALAKHRIFTAITKHTTVNEWRTMLEAYYHDVDPILNPLRYACVSIGMGEDNVAYLREIDMAMYDYEIASPLKVVIDVANGHMKKFAAFVQRVRDAFPHAFIMAGTVATPDATEQLLLHGADLVRVGIGTGAVCTTRRVSGVGYPQFSAVMECAEVADAHGGGIISDGGCVHPGDFAKALGAGAKMVMAGSIFAGHTESEQEVDGGCVTFYGMSSHAAQEKHGEVRNYRSSEGRVVKIPYKGDVNLTVLDILGGIRSACAYVGARNLTDIDKYARFVRVNHQLNQSLDAYTIS